MILDLVRKHGIEKRVILQSFDPRTLRAMKKLDPSIPRAALFETNRDWPEVAREFDATLYSPEYHLVTKERVAQAHASGLQVVPWTVNKAEDWQRLADAGADAIISDDPASLIAWLKENPDKATLGVIGVGSPTHIWAIKFQASTGSRFQFVPYRGAAPIMQDLLAGQVDLSCLAASDLLPQVRNGNLKAYAILAKTPWSAAPEIPVIDVAGMPGLDMPLWNAIWAPKGAPREIIGKLNASVVETLRDPTVRRRFTDVGQEIYPPDQQTPEALGALQKAEIDKWWPIIKSAGIKPE